MPFFSGGCLRPFLWSRYKYWIIIVAYPRRSPKDMHNGGKKPSMTFDYQWNLLNCAQMFHPKSQKWHWSLGKDQGQNLRESICSMLSSPNCLLWASFYPNIPTLAAPPWEKREEKCHRLAEILSVSGISCWERGLFFLWKYLSRHRRLAPQLILSLGFNQSVRTCP